MTYDKESEKIAIDNLRRGDASTFDTIYQLHKRRIYSLCLRMTSDPAIAEELTQEAFLLAYRRIETFRGDAAFSTWLHRIAVNVVLMHVRQAKSRGFHTSLEEYGVDDENNSLGERLGTADRSLASSIDRVSLTRAIDQLAPGYRVVLVLHDIEGYEHTEIAEMLGCSVGNTKSQLHKARLRLRDLLMGRARPPRAVAAGFETRAA